MAATPHRNGVCEVYPAALAIFSVGLVRDLYLAESLYGSNGLVTS